jgi:hypothetical protein
MNNLSGDTVTLSQLVRTEEHGLNVNRLLFAKFLVMTGRISEGDLSGRQPLMRIPTGDGTPAETPELASTGSRSTSSA